MAKYAYWANDYTGGGTGALDKISETNLADMDMAVIVCSTGNAGSPEVNVYWLDDDSAASEAKPTVIAPDDDTTGKRWVQVFAADQDLTQDSTGVVFADMVATGTINAETCLVAGATGGATGNEVIKIHGAAANYWWIDTDNAGHLKKYGNMAFSADPGDTAASTLMQFLTDGSNAMEIDSNQQVTVPNNLLVGSTGTGSNELDVILNQDGSTIVKIDNANNHASAYSQLLVDGYQTNFNTALGGYTEIRNSHASGTGTIIGNTADIPMLFGINNAEVARLSSTGTAGLTLADGQGLNLQEAITFTGATTENLIEIPDNLADALSIKEAGNAYITFNTGDTGAFVHIKQNTTIPDAGYIGSESVPTALQIEADGDVVVKDRLFAGDGLYLENNVPIWWKGSSGGWNAILNISTANNLQFIQQSTVEGNITFVNKFATGLISFDVDTSTPGVLIDSDANVMLGCNAHHTNMTKGVSLTNAGTAPSAGVANHFAMYGDDIAAGNCAPHFMTENNTIIKLSQSLHTADSPSFAGLSLTGNLALAANSITGTSVDLSNAELQQLSLIGATTISAGQWEYLGTSTAAGGAMMDAANAAAQMALLSGNAGAAFSFNSQNLTSVGTIGCGTVTCTSDYILTNGNYIGISAAERIEFLSAGQVVVQGGDFGIGSQAGPTANGGKVLYFGDNTADPTMDTDTCGVYGKDVTGTVEVFAIDEAENEVQATSHNFTLFNPDSNEPYPWSFYAKNRHLGVEVNVDMAGAIREIERLSGKQFIHYNDVPKIPMRDSLKAKIPKWLKERMDKEE
jgi:hypothetical protein